MSSYNTRLSPGSTFEERYEIRSLLGEGGFGSVYQARQRTTGQSVALKLLRLDHESGARTERRIARFLREAKVCAQLHHPNIVQLIDSGRSSEGVLYSVFAFAPGETLADVIAREGALAPREATHLMLQALDALACAHAQGVVHRDLKPRNIMVISSGARRNALVLDFGIGAILGGVAAGGPPARLTATDEALGTPGYAAPEQLRGLDITTRTDLFAWGLVFLECLTGKMVYDGASAAEVLYRMLGPEPVPIPAEIERTSLGALLRRVTHKDVAARDLDARGVLQALEGLHPGSPGQHPSGSAAMSPGAHAPLDGVALLEPRRVQASGERRHVTAVCCVLDPVLEAARPVDDEDLDELVRRASSTCADVAAKHRGHVVAAFGHAVMLYFGLLCAEEDDAKRAARAALAIVEAIQGEREDLRRAHGARVEVRIGLHSGLVQASGLREGAAAGLALGATPRLAARIAREAPPSAIVVSAEAQRLLRASFELEDEGARCAGGREGAPGAFRLRRARADRGPPPTPDGTMGPIIGRSQEMDLLLDRWQRARQGGGQCALITGEPGIGKSRLARELRGRLVGDAHVYLEGRCSPETQNNALFPVIDALGRALELDRESSSRGRSARLEAQLARRGLAPAEAVPLLAPLFGLPIEPPYAPLQAGPQRQKELTLNAILSLLFGMAEEAPVLLLIEDLHWADPTSLALLGQFAREVPSAAVCLVLTARPEFVPPFPTTGMQQIHLSRLEAAQIGALIAELLGKKPLPRDVVEQIALRTDGVPLFVEELTRTMLEAGVLLERQDRYDLSRPLSDVEIPGTLRGLLLSRLDQLGRAKETAQIAAALGREFSEEVLLAVSRLEGAAVREDLSRLLGAGLVFRKRRLKGSGYTFKHALVQDAAYESLSRAARRQVHARIARTLEERFAGIVEARPELLARHHAGAEQKLEAIAYAQIAAQRALTQSAYAEASGHARDALEWLGATPPDRRRAELELALNGVLTQALMSTRGWADPEVKSTIDRSGALLEQLERDSPHRLPTLWSLFTYHHTASNRRAARDVAEELVSAAERSSDAGLRAAAMALRGITRYCDGEHVEARQALERAIALYDPAQHQDHGLKFGLDTQVLAKTLLAHLRWYAGDSAAAFQLVQDGIAWAREVRHVPSVAIGLLYGCQIYQFHGDRGAVEVMSGEILSLAKKHGLPAFEGYAAFLHAWAKGDASLARGIVEQLERLGCRVGLSYWGSLPAAIDAASGRLDAAIACVERCLSVCRAIDEHFYEPELYRLLAVYRLRREASDEGALAALRRAAELARRQAMSLVEALATVELQRRSGHDPSNRARLAELLESCPGLRAQLPPGEIDPLAAGGDGEVQRGLKGDCV
ncbi:protein kinase [Sorangium cellulosum]|uniref:Protein kinase n=1 Tax=Sorangium cellulosum TaxID=56 RepID=A0A4P2PW52_SORCE|nr:TOMM system kinase/cyclase fusion protein [Sorangium cellulosum]AUX20801.1 protein kinase [Sorangium cellulosum]